MVNHILKSCGISCERVKYFEVNKRVKKALFIIILLLTNQIAELFEQQYFQR